MTSPFRPTTNRKNSTACPPRLEPGLTVGLTDQLSVNAGLVLQPVQDPAVAGDDRVFDDQGFFVEVLTLDYEAVPVHLFGGKMHVNFANAWDVTPGVYGTDLAEEYEMAENIGLGGAYSFETGEARTHTITAQTFFLDTSGLAESAFTQRKKTREGDGGPGNTGSFKSFAVSLDGGNIAALKGFSYHAAYVHHTNDTVSAENESRFAVNGAYEFALPGDITAQPSVEYVRFDDADGTQDQDRTYLTAALAFTYGDWNMAFSGTFKETEAADGTETDESNCRSWRVMHSPTASVPTSPTSGPATPASILTHSERCCLMGLNFNPLTNQNEG